MEGVDSIVTDNYANRKLNYYYYIPVKVLKEKEISHPLLMCVPGLSQRGEDYVTPIFREFADREGWIIISPSFMFDDRNWEKQESYQFPAAWSGRAMLSILDSFRKKNKPGISRIYMHGFSAGAQFAIRFPLWKPGYCMAVSGHAAGGASLPVKKVPDKYFISACHDDKTRVEIADRFYQDAKNLGFDITYKKYPGGHFLPIEQIQDSLKFFRKIEEKSKK